MVMNYYDKDREGSIKLAWENLRKYGQIDTDHMEWILEQLEKKSNKIYMVSSVYYIEDYYRASEPVAFFDSLLKAESFVQQKLHAKILEDYIGKELTDKLHIWSNINTPDMYYGHYSRKNIPGRPVMPKHTDQKIAQKQHLVNLEIWKNSEVYKAVVEEANQRAILAKEQGTLYFDYRNKLKIELESTISFEDVPKEFIEDEARYENLYEISEEVVE